MATTTFSGPVVSQNGFQSDTLVIGSTTLTTGSAVSGVVGTDQVGYIPVQIGGVTKYIPLYTTLTL
jgi:hypothetical protein